MRIRSPSLPELHAFVAAARLNNFAKAADALNVTPGAISRAVSRLEEQLGQPLFTRHGRGSALTAEGRAYFESVASAIDALEGAALRAQVSQEQTALKLSVSPTLASHWLIRRLPDFQRQYPEITLSFVPYRHEEYPVLAGLGASLRGGDGHWPAGMEGDYVTGRQIVPVCRPADVSPTASPGDLAQRPLLFHTLHPGTLKKWFDGMGCASDTLRPAASFEQVSQLLEAAVAGMGIAVVQRCLIDDHLLAGRLAIAHPGRVDNHRGYYLCYPEPLRRAPAIVALRNWLQQQGREHEQASEAATPAAA